MSIACIPVGVVRLLAIRDLVGTAHRIFDCRDPLILGRQRRVVGVATRERALSHEAVGCVPGLEVEIAAKDKWLLAGEALEIPEGECSMGNHDLGDAELAGHVVGSDAEGGGRRRVAEA